MLMMRCFFYSIFESGMSRQEGFSLPSQDKDNAEDGPEAELGKLGSQVG